jgi:serine/threonine protein kinase
VLKLCFETIIPTLLSSRNMDLGEVNPASVYAFQVRWLLDNELVSPEMLKVFPRNDNTNLQNLLLANHLITQTQAKELEEALNDAFSRPGTVFMSDESVEGTSVMAIPELDAAEIEQEQLRKLDFNETMALDALNFKPPSPSQFPQAPHQESAAPHRTGSGVYHFDQTLQNSQPAEPSFGSTATISSSGARTFAAPATPGSGVQTFFSPLSNSSGAHNYDSTDTLPGSGAHFNPNVPLLRSGSHDFDSAETIPSSGIHGFNPNTPLSASGVTTFQPSTDHIPTQRNRSLSSTSPRPPSMRTDPYTMSSLPAANDTVPISKVEPSRRRSPASPEVERKSYLSDYTVLDKIDQGAMGEIFKARHKTRNQTVAIKTILSEEPDEEDILRFQREAKVLSQLDHPNIVRILDMGHEGNHSHIIMEYVKGSTLQELIDDFIKNKRMNPPLDWVIKLFTQLANALNYCHGRGIVHRDIKPANVIIEAATERPVLIDFGLVTKKQGPKEGSQSSVAGFTQDVSRGSAEFVRGTPYFISPEQVKTDEFGAVGAPSDVWSFGVSLYFALTGQPPFPGGSILDILEALLQKAAPAPSAMNPEVPRWLDDLVLHCLTKKNSQRPSMETVFRALSKMAKPRKKRIGNNNLWPLVITGVVVLGVLLNNLAWLSSNSSNTVPKTAMVIRTGIDLEALQFWADLSLEVRAKLRKKLKKKLGSTFKTAADLAVEFDGRIVSIPCFRHGGTDAVFHWIPTIEETERLLSDNE